MKKLVLAVIGAVLVVIFGLQQSTWAVNFNKSICNGNYTTEEKELAGCSENRTIHENIVGKVIKEVLKITGVIAVVMVIYGGFLLLTSAGNLQKVTRGKNVILWAIVGLIVSGLAFMIVRFILNKI